MKKIIAKFHIQSGLLVAWNNIFKLAISYK